MAWTTPKTNWATGELVTAEDMNAVGENLAVLGALRSTVAVYTTPADIDGLSTDFVDVDSDNLNLTITTAGGDVQVHFHGTVYCRTRRSVRIDVEVDGTRQGGDDGMVQTASPSQESVSEIVSFTRLIQNLSAGTHTFKLQWKTNQSITLYAGAQFWVREI